MTSLTGGGTGLGKSVKDRKHSYVLAQIELSLADDDVLGREGSISIYLSMQTGKSVEYMAQIGEKVTVQTLIFVSFYAWRFTQIAGK